MIDRLSTAAKVSRYHLLLRTARRLFCRTSQLPDLCNNQTGLVLQELRTQNIGALLQISAATATSRSSRKIAPVCCCYSRPAWTRVVISLPNCIHICTGIPTVVIHSVRRVLAAAAPAGTAMHLESHDIWQSLQPAKNFPSQLQLIDEVGCKMKKLQKHTVYWTKKSILKSFPRLDNCCCIAAQEKKAKMGLITRPHAFTQAKFFSQCSQLWSAESSSIPPSFTTTKNQSNWQSPDDDNSSSSACMIFTSHSRIKLQTRFFLLSTNNQKDLNLTKKPPKSTQKKIIL
jgi:hypothetical protein